MSALHLVTGIPWAIMEPTLKTITEIADRTEVDLNTLREWKPEAIEAVDGQPSRRGSFTIRDGVAIIDVVGPIFRYADIFTEISGATALASLAKDFNTALTDINVKSILLNIDSPGGQADGIAEFADMVRGAQMIKPVHAFIGGMGASAAFWIAAAAGSITIAKTGFAGSIGVVATFFDTKKRDEMEGLKELKFVSSVSPNKHLDPGTDKGAAEIQTIVDNLADVFVNAVADFRGVSAETVLSKFGQGSVMMGEDAVASGLVDSLGSFEGVLSSMASSNSVQSKGIEMTEKTTATTETESVNVVTLESVRTGHPDIAAALIAEGATAERGRILAIEANALPGHEALVAEMKADGSITADNAAVKILQAEKAKGAARLDSIASAVEDVPDVASDTVTTATSTVNENAPIEERAKADWDASSDLRSEFNSDYDVYFAAVKAEDEDRVSVHTK